jgi:hypothetical protein
VSLGERGMYRAMAAMPDLGAPISYLVLEPGADVYDPSGDHVGKVEHVLADPDVDIFEGLVIDTRVGPGGLRFADADQIDELYERGVVLSVGVEELHDPEPGPATLEADPDDVEESELAARLRRAWDWISGRY